MVKPDEELRYYSQRMPSVEINTSFHGLPTLSTLQRWASMVIPAFSFTLKTPQAVSHKDRLGPESAEHWDVFVQRAREGLGSHLGVLLVQLPPSFHKDLPRLTAFLARRPAGVRIALEVRSATWLDAETFAVLRQANVALVECITPDNALPLCCEQTADFSYMRFHKYAREDNETDWTDAMLAPHVARAAARRRCGADQYAYFLNDIAAHGPRNARRFLELTLAAAGDSEPAIPGWRPPPPVEKGGKGSLESLFAQARSKGAGDSKARRDDSAADGVKSVDVEVARASPAKRTAEAQHTAEQPLAKKADAGEQPLTKNADMGDQPQPRKGETATLATQAAGGALRPRLPAPTRPSDLPGAKGLRRTSAGGGKSSPARPPSKTTKGQPSLHAFFGGGGGNK